MRAPLLGLLLLAGCGTMLMSTARAATPKAPDEVYTCIQNQLGPLGYRRTTYDPMDRRLVGERVDPELRAASGLFRRGYHRLEVIIRPHSSGNTQVETKLQTFMEYSTQQGITTEEVKVPARARADEQKLLEVCATSTP